MTKLERFVVAALLIAGAACSKPDDKAAGGAAAPASPRDAVVEAWKAAKLVATPLSPATVAFGKDCQSTTVEGIDVLLCNYAAAADAKAAQDPGLAWVGDTTGASQAHGAALVVLADRKKADPSGKTINRLMKLAPK